MPQQQVGDIIAVVGIAAQFAGSVLLAVLFFVLWRHAMRRSYFATWAQAWLALAVAITALLVRFLLAPTAGGELLSEGDPHVRALYFVYQFAKLLHYGLLFGGTAVYAAGPDSRNVFPCALVASAAFAAISVGLSSSLNAVVAWQSPIACVVLATCAATLLTLPPSRRSLGSKATGTVFGLIAGLWMLYLAGFSLMLWRDGVYVPGPLSMLLRYNSFTDLLLQMLLGYGMVLILMEDSKREVDDAHAELEVAHNQLRRKALYDALTGALNRRAFVEGVGLEGAKATFGSVVMADMDNLKIVNDTAGHAAGDLLLEHMVEVLRGTLRPSDRLYRWGGDEFLLVLPGARAVDVAPRLEKAIADSEPLLVSAAPTALRLLVSLGAVDYVGAEGLPGAIERADREMYRQKHHRKLAGDQNPLPVG